MTKTQQPSSAFRVGDRVRVQLGQHKVKGMILEDRGPLGLHGRRIFVVRVPTGPEEPLIWETSEDNLEAIGKDEEPEPPLEKAKIMDYFRRGGLVSILRSNLRGGSHPPAVWLYRDHHGNVTHSFDPEDGLIGGQLVPARALWGSKILEAKRDQVKAYLRSFGLDRDEAEEVIEAVGTSPGSE